MATETNKGDRSKPVWGDGGAAKKAAPAQKAAPAKQAAATKAAAKKARSPKKATPGKGSKPARKASTATARRPAGSSAQLRRLRQRYVPVHDTDGPRVRLGLLWFLLAFVALVIGGVPTAFVYGVAAAIAGAQTARAWRKRKLARPSELMAAGGAGLIAVGACFGAGGAGLGILGCVVVAYVGVQGDSGSPNARIADMGMTLQCALPVGIVCLSMVLLTRLDRGSAVALLLLVSAYETGDFLIGAGAANPYEGPAAGVAAIVVITFILSTLPITTLSFGEAWLFGGLVAVLAPAGQWLASALLPSASSPASALRRLDSLLITAPLWAWGVGLVLQG